MHSVSCRYGRYGVDAGRVVQAFAWSAPMREPAKRLGINDAVLEKRPESLVGMGVAEVFDAEGVRDSWNGKGRGQSPMHFAGLWLTPRPSFYIATFR